MRRAIIIGSAVVVALALPAVGLAVMQTQGGGHVNCAASASSNSGVTTTATTFSKISALELNVESAFGMSESVTLILSGSPVYLKVIDTSVGGSFPLDPGLTTLRATPDNDAPSLTFVTIGLPASHMHTLDVEWRLKSTGGSATIKRSVVNLLYEAGDAGCPFV